MKCDYCGSHNSADQHQRCVFCGAQIQYRRVEQRYSRVDACATAVCDSWAAYSGMAPVGTSLNDNPWLKRKVI